VQDRRLAAHRRSVAPTTDATPRRPPTDEIGGRERPVRIVRITLGTVLRFDRPRGKDIAKTQVQLDAEGLEADIDAL
jgi:hypothetical protein